MLKSLITHHQKDAPMIMGLKARKEYRKRAVTSPMTSLVQMPEYTSQEEQKQVTKTEKRAMFTEVAVKSWEKNEATCEREDSFNMNRKRQGDKQDHAIEVNSLKETQEGVDAKSLPLRPVETAPSVPRCCTSRRT